MLELLKHCMLTPKNEWVVESNCTHHMENNASLLSSLDMDTKKKIYVADDFSLKIIGHGDIPYQHGQIINLYHVKSLIANLFSISQLI